MSRMGSFSLSATQTRYSPSELEQMGISWAVQRGGEWGYYCIKLGFISPTSRYSKKIISQSMNFLTKTLAKNYHKKLYSGSPGENRIFRGYFEIDLFRV